MSIEGIDFGIVTAIPCEREAIVSRLSQTRRVRGSPPDIRDYYIGRIDLKLYPDHYTVVVVQCSQAGNSDSGQAAKDLIARWNPACLVMLGIAAGVPRGDLCIGDVVVATELFEYDYRRIFGGDWQARPRHHVMCPLLLARLHHAPVWPADDVPPPPGQDSGHRRSKAHKPGPIAAGNALLADADFRSRLLTYQQDLVAVEMESEGVAVAAWQRHPPIPVFVVRGICDLGDAATKADASSTPGASGAGNAEAVKQLRHESAAAAAASYLVHFLQDEPVPPTCCKDACPGPLSPNARVEATNAGGSIELARSLRLPPGAVQGDRQKFTAVFENATAADLPLILQFLQQMAMDTTLSITASRPGSLIVEVESSPEGYRRIKSAFDQQRLPSSGVTKLGSIVRLIDYTMPDVLPADASLFRMRSAALADKRSTMICRRQWILGYAKQYREAISLVGPATRRIEEMIVYVTLKDSVIYAHSNFCSSGSVETTKIATNETNDLLELCFNLYTDQDEISEDERRELIDAHENLVQYYVNEKLVRDDGGFEIQRQGARNIRLVG